MILHETYTLSNGVKIPKVGFGTWKIKDDSAARAVKTAIDVGYRHIDTAQAYRNERGTGEGIRTSGISRDAIFVTTKLAAEIKNYAKAIAAIDGSLQKLGLDYVDMVLIHSPQPWADFRGSGNYDEGNKEAWRALEDAYKAGKARAIGVSNFEQHDIENILTSAAITPMANQILLHISNTPFELVAYCQKLGMLVEAYSPIAHGEMLHNQAVGKMAAKYGVSIPQLCIRYALQLETVPLPKATSRSHIEENARVDFVISDEDMVLLKNWEPIEDYGASSVEKVFRFPPAKKKEAR